MRNKPFSWFWPILSILLVLSACQGSGPPISELVEPTVAPTIPPTVFIPTSPIELPQLTPLADPLGTPIPVLTNDGTVMRFSFPTPGPAPVSKWRPPLYPVPWALTNHDHYYFIRPIAADEVNWPEADYRYGGTIAEGETVHSGIDIEAPRNTPILAAGSGRVIWAGYGLLRNNKDVNDPYGLAVAIEHDFGYNNIRLSTVYAHMDRIDVTVGQHVDAGAQLGIIGITGLTSGPHLHFEVRFKYGEYYTSRNPELWLAPPQGWGVLVGRLIREDGAPIHNISVFVRNLESNQLWEVKTYGPKNVRSDDYWAENMVLSDLPAGRYEILFEYDEKPYQLQLEIHAGGTSFFSYMQGRGLNTKLPATPSPEEWLSTPTKTK